MSRKPLICLDCDTDRGDGHTLDDCFTRLKARVRAHREEAELATDAFTDAERLRCAAEYALEIERDRAKVLEAAMSALVSELKLDVTADCKTPLSVVPTAFLVIRGKRVEVEMESALKVKDALELPARRDR